MPEVEPANSSLSLLAVGSVGEGPEGQAEVDSSVGEGPEELGVHHLALDALHHMALHRAHEGAKHRLPLQALCQLVEQALGQASSSESLVAEE